MSQKMTPADVGQHRDDANGYWLIIENDVYDLTSKSPASPAAPDKVCGSLSLTSPACIEFMDEHPGGSNVLKRFAGKNATKAFWKYHSESVLKRYGAKYKIGEVGEAAKL